MQLKFKIFSMNKKLVLSGMEFIHNGEFIQITPLFCDSPLYHSKSGLFFNLQD